MLHEKETMTARERVLRAFHHVPADRVPIDYLYNPGIDERLKQHYGLRFEADTGWDTI